MSKDIFEVLTEYAVNESVNIILLPKRSISRYRIKLTA